MSDTMILRLDRPALMSVENFGGFQKIADIDEKNQIVHTVLMQLNYITRNRTWYSGEDFVRCLTQSPYIQEQIAQGVWYGELEHPEKNCSQERFFKIDDKNISHKILDYKVEGDLIKGHCQFVAPMGHIPWDWIQKNSNIAFSVRVFTPNFLEAKDEKGMVYIKKVGEMVLITFDCVKMPGCQLARIANPTEFANQNNTTYEDRMGGKEEYDIKSIEMPKFHWRNTMSQEEFTNILSREDSSIRILEDVYKFDHTKTKITYNNDNTVKIQLNSNEALNLPINMYELMKVTNAKYISTAGKSFKEVIPSVSTEKYDLFTPASQEDYLNWDYEADISQEYMQSEEKMLAKAITYDEYEKEVKPSLRKELDIIYSEFDKVLREVFDQEMDTCPQKYGWIIEKAGGRDKIFQEFKKLYVLNDKSKVLQDIENYVYRRTKFALAVKRNGRYIPFVRINFKKDSLNAMTTKEDRDRSGWGWGALAAFLLVGIFSIPVICIWLHHRRWRGYHIGKMLTQRINDRISKRFADIKHYAKQSAGNRDHQIMLKLNFRLKRREAEDRRMQQ